MLCIVFLAAFDGLVTTHSGAHILEMQTDKTKVSPKLQFLPHSDARRTFESQRRYLAAMVHAQSAVRCDRSSS
jgi:hypothetical protein